MAGAGAGNQNMTGLLRLDGLLGVIAYVALLLPGYGYGATSAASTARCDAARQTTMACLNETLHQLHHRVDGEDRSRWFANATGSDRGKLLQLLCSEYTSSAKCICRLKDDCSLNDADAFMASTSVAHFGVYNDLCSYQNLTAELARQPRCYKVVQQVFNDCLQQCWTSQQCSKCTESVDCIEQFAGASCNKDAQFIKTVKLLTRIKETIIDEKGCFSDSYRPLNQSFRLKDISSCPAPVSGGTDHMVSHSARASSWGGIASVVSILGLILLWQHGPMT